MSAGAELTPGNRVTLLVDGEEAHAAQLDAIRGARHHIHLVVYILTGEKVGQRYLAALTERARAGVKVRLMYDGLGGRALPGAYRDALAAAGVEVHEYAPLHGWRFWRITRRQHRKILVVDGRIAFTGGINLYDEYPGGEGDPPGWRDTHVRIEGPAVPAFQRLFLATWRGRHGELADEPAFFPPLAVVGEESVGVVIQHGHDLVDLLAWPLRWLARRLRGGRPPIRDQPIYRHYLAAFEHAQRRIWVTQAYFVPNRELKRALLQAARRGVDVRLMVPAYTDIGFLLQATHRHFAALLRAGVRLFEYRQAVLHAKTAVVDGAWSTVGSSNLDFRSFMHNDEANAIIVGPEFARAMERLFVADQARTREVTRAAWERRPLRDRVLERLSVLYRLWI